MTDLERIARQLANQSLSDLREPCRFAQDEWQQAQDATTSLETGRDRPSWHADCSLSTSTKSKHTSTQPLTTERTSDETKNFSTPAPAATIERGARLYMTKQYRLDGKTADDDLATPICGKPPNTNWRTHAGRPRRSPEDPVLKTIRRPIMKDGHGTLLRPPLPFPGVTHMNTLIFLSLAAIACSPPPASRQITGQYSPATSSTCQPARSPPSAARTSIYMSSWKLTDTTFSTALAIAATNGISVNIALDLTGGTGPLNNRSHEL